MCCIFVVKNNENYGVGCSVVMPASEKSIDSELRRPDGEGVVLDPGVAPAGLAPFAYVEPLGKDH